MHTCEKLEHFNRYTLQLLHLTQHRRRRQNAKKAIHCCSYETLLHRSSHETLTALIRNFASTANINSKKVLYSVEEPEENKRTEEFNELSERCCPFIFQ